MPSLLRFYSKISQNNILETMNERLNVPNNEYFKIKTYLLKQ